MRQLSLQEAADFLESAAIAKTEDFGHAIVHAGRDASGIPFVLVNDSMGETIVTQPN